MNWRAHLVGWLAVIGFILLIGFLSMLIDPPIVGATCQPEPVTPNTPTGIAGCVVYGEGVASRWRGPGVARNDCLWPWDDCTTIRITSRETRRSLVVTPTMFCDCFTGTSRERIVDLDPASLRALGLRWADGLYPVRVSPVRRLPDAAMQP